MSGRRIEMLALRIIVSNGVRVLPNMRFDVEPERAARLLHAGLARLTDWTDLAELMRLPRTRRALGPAH